MSPVTASVLPPLLAVPDAPPAAVSSHFPNVRPADTTTEPEDEFPLLTLADSWQAVLLRLRQQLSAPSFETWIRPLVPLPPDPPEPEADEAALAQPYQISPRLRLATHRAFHRNWVLKHYREAILEAWQAVWCEATHTLAADTVGVPFALQVEVHTGLPAPAPTEEAEQTRLFCPSDPALAARPASTPPASIHLPLSPPVEALPQRAWTPRSAAAQLNPRYTFEAFVVGQQNRFAHAAALAVAETPAASYNPLFLYGGVGLGKTHLMQAVGHYVLQRHPELTVRYVTAEQFTNDLISALGSKNMTPFRDRYRRIDVLILDDVQFLEGKERTQEEIFHTFNTLHQAGKQIILSSDRSPKHLSRLEDRLRSRFEWGLIADIQPPDLETRIAILQQKAIQFFAKETTAAANLQEPAATAKRSAKKAGPASPPPAIPLDVLSLIAEHHPHNIRELEGALNKVLASATLTRSPLTHEAVQALLGHRVEAQRLSMDDILQTVARYYHLGIADLKSPQRAKDISHARQVAIYLLRTLLEASFPKIGEALGGRKHPTVLYAFEKIQADLDTHPVLRQQLDAIQQQLAALSRK